MPVMTRLLLTCLLAVAVAGCGGATAGSAAAHDGHETGSAVAPTALPSAGEIQTGCADGTGDTAPAAGSGASDMTDVAMVSDSGTVVLAFTFAGPVPARGDLVLAVEATSQDGGTVRQLGIKVHDGQPQGAFIGNPSGAAPTQLTDAVHIADHAVHAAFPISSVKDLGSSWRWYAVVGSADGIQDLCPGGTDTTLGTIGAISVG
jgi:hypothetical protein